MSISVKEIFCNRWPPMTNGKKWKRTGKWEPGRIGCGRDTIVKIRLWLVVRAFTLVQPFCFHCYDRYEFRKCNIVVDSVLNDNVEKFQRQKNPNSAFLPMVRFPFVWQNWPARPSLQNANFTFYKTVRPDQSIPVYKVWVWWIFKRNLFKKAYFIFKITNPAG